MGNLFKLEAAPGYVMILLGALGLFLDFAAQFSGLPPVVSQLIQVVEFVLVTMGIREVMLQEKTKILQKVLDLKSKTLWGTLLIGFSAAIAAILGDPMLEQLPNVVQTVLQVVGALLGIGGLGHAAWRGRGITAIGNGG